MGRGVRVGGWQGKARQGKARQGKARQGTMRSPSGTLVEADGGGHGPRPARTARRAAAGLSGADAPTLSPAVVVPQLGVP